MNSEGMNLQPANLCPICRLRSITNGGYLCDTCEARYPSEVLSWERLNAMVIALDRAYPKTALHTAVAIVVAPATESVLRNALTMQEWDPARLIPPQFPPIWKSVHAFPDEVFLPQTNEERDALIDGSYWVNRLPEPINQYDNVICKSYGMNYGKWELAEFEGWVWDHSRDRTSYRIMIRNVGLRVVHVRSIVRKIANVGQTD